MASAVDQLIKIQITKQTSAVPQASFSIPLIIGSTGFLNSDVVRSYSSPEGMLADGFTTSSPEYVYALAMYSQDITPNQFYVGKRTAAVAQVNTFAVNTITPSHVYSFTINQVVISYTAGGSETQQSILSGLLAALGTAFPTAAPVTGVVSGTGSGALLTLTSAIAGNGVSYTAIDALLTHAVVTANHGIANDLATIIAANNSWYGIALCSNSDADILQLAGAVEALKKIFLGASNDAAIATSSTTDLLSVLAGKEYDRTALMYSPGSYNKGIEAAWMGGQLPATPGSNNWAYKTLKSISPDALTDNVLDIIRGNPVASLPGKNGNVYTTIGGVNITQMGQMVSGQYIDITVGIDWLESTIQANIFTVLTQTTKIPYTDNGTNMLIQAVQSAIDQGVVNGLIDGASPITISAPKVLEVPQSQRANRVAPTISFSCRLQGAVNAVIVSGTVSV